MAMLRASFVKGTVALTILLSVTRSKGWEGLQKLNFELAYNSTLLCQFSGLELVE